ncbi:MAG: FecR domain-containing protein [Flavobacteriales bacterium]|nr:FecR domain-containing protein [Flavobacteriales bacterium]
MDHHGIDSDLLARYVAGEADPWQRGQVEAWAGASRTNAQELERMQRIWSITADAGSTAFAAEMRAWATGAEAMAKAKAAEDRAWALGAAAEARARLMEDRAWARVEARIAEAEGKGRVRSIRGGSGTWTRWLAAAAVVAGLVFAARWFLQPKAVEHVAQAEAVELLLADNSRGVLSPGSRMEERMGKRRAIRLEGEAYFEVRRDEQRPFTVEAGDLLVTVLGTAFEVSAYDTSEFVQVRVRSGRVRVEAGVETLELGAGEHARFNKERHFLERRPAPPAEVWGLRVLQFEGATLRQVADQLQRIYKVRISLRHDGIARCTLTAEFDDETIDTILGLIADTFSLQVERAPDGSYTLDGDGC